jgi:3-dehydroquinate synthase
MNEVWVELGERRYPVLVGDGLLEAVGEQVARMLPKCRSSAIVTDSNVGPLYAGAVVESLQSAGITTSNITVPAGEPSKSMSCAEDVCRQMVRAGLDRSSSVIALGGGVIGDLAGFCAAIFFRGIPYVQVPTTVVAQVDSSVGGKTGVNTPEGKNLLGAFHQPSLVLADVDTLQTLPTREFNEGFAEVIKHAAIRDRGMIEMIGPMTRDRSGLSALVLRNVAIKARIVGADERETTGGRALLNFGHTIGHAIEASAGYGALLHGEAISLGMVAALRISREAAGLSAEESDRIEAILDLFDLPRRLPGHVSTAAIMEKLGRDKKFTGGKIRFVLLRRLGEAFVSHDVTRDQIAAAVEALR